MSAKPALTGAAKGRKQHGTRGRTIPVRISRIAFRLRSRIEQERCERFDGSFRQMPQMPVPDAKGGILPEFLPGFTRFPAPPSVTEISAPRPVGATIRVVSFVFILLSFRP
jgi:hypothetical protein